MPSRLTLDDELLYPSLYVCAGDLKGKDTTLTITATNAQELVLVGGAKTKRKLILTFKEAKKKMICNVTNANTLVDLYGPKAEGFIGKRITIYPTKANFKGDMVDAVRIRDKVPAAKTPAMKPDEMPTPNEAEGAAE
jgi:hypothetical protein